jgi:hypothetical protein
MSDIFLSYAREDRAVAAGLAVVLPEHGWSVFWDRQILAGTVFDEAIEREINAARCVIALWSAASVASQWVRAEAEEGASRNILISVLIEDVKLPIGVRRIQAANLAGWLGDPGDERLPDLIQAVAFQLSGHAPVSKPAFEFDPAVLRTIEENLARFVGPIAGVLVAKAARQTAGTTELCEMLARQIPAKAEREDFLSACQKRVPSHATPEFVTQLARDLSVYLGPIARVLVNRALAKAADNRELYELLSREIPSESERQEFLKSRRE